MKNIFLLILIAGLAKANDTKWYWDLKNCEKVNGLGNCSCSGVGMRDGKPTCLFCNSATHGRCYGEPI